MMMFDPMALDAANQLIAERRTRAELDALADAGATWRAMRTRRAREVASMPVMPTRLDAARGRGWATHPERWIPLWNWR